MGNCCCCCSKKANPSDDSANGIKENIIEEHGSTINPLPVPAESAILPQEKDFGAFSSEPVQFAAPIEEHSDDSSIKKHKAAASNATIELRIFLPHIGDAHDKSWITPDVMRSYRDSLQLVTLEALNGNSTPEPNHEDKYVLGTADFAVKYKSGKTLELNVRNAANPIWMEKWIKTKFGKHTLSDYKSDVLNHLSEAGHGDEASVTAFHIDDPKHLSVVKSRNAWKVKNVCIEVVELTVPLRQDNCEDVKRKKWLSIAVQGQPKEIEEYILHSHTARDLWKCFTIARRIYSQNPSQALTSHFVPVVSGYPLWLRLCANLVDQQEVEKEIAPSMDGLMHFLK